MAEDRYEREERYGRRYGSQDYGDQPREERRSYRGGGNREFRSDYERGNRPDWSTDDLGYSAQGRGTESWRRDRSFPSSEDRYEPRQDRQGRNRDFLEKAGDEVASWFGDEDAASRRRADHFRGKGPKGYTRSDDRIAEDVNDRLTDDPWLDASDIDVSVAGGEVTLAGEVSSRPDKRRAEDCADAVSGVVHVQNNLRVRSANYASPSLTDDLS